MAWYRAFEIVAFQYEVSSLEASREMFGTFDELHLEEEFPMSS